MEIVLIVVIILLSIATFYIMYLKSNIKRVTRMIKEKRQVDTNTIITTTTNNKEIVALIQEVDDMMISFRKLETGILKKNQSLQRAIVNISHDLKTPLTSALGYIELLQQYHVDKEEQVKYQQIIIDKLKRVSLLIEDFFEFTKIVSSEEPLQLQQIDSNRILEEAIVCYYQDFHNQKREVQITGNHELVIPSNEQVLRRIFDNIIINALKHGQGNLLISVEEEHDICIMFTNLIEEVVDVDQIFDEFYTSDISRTKKNTGLGLAIAKEFTEMLGGSIKASVDESIFTITLVIKKV